MTIPVGQAANLPTDRHWCAVERDQLPEVIKAQCDRYWRRIQAVGLLALWRASDRAYYASDEKGGWASSAAVSFGGDSDELVMPRANHYRSLQQAILATATAERPSFQAKSVSDDTQSLIEAPIATGVIDAFYREKNMELLVQRDCERALIYAIGFMHLRWSVHEGPPVMQPAGMPASPNEKPPMVQATDRNGVPLRQGDVVPASCSPVSVVHELDAQRNKLDWALVAHREDAFELAARYPQFEGEIKDAIGRPRWPERVWCNDASGEVPEAGDTKITVWCLYHRKTSAVPQGRYAIVAADRVLYDGPALLADEVPVYAIIPMIHLDTGHGHSASWDLLNLQELYDSGLSALATGHDAFGVQNVLTPNGSGVNAEDIEGGLKVVPYEPGPNGEKPEALNLLKLTKEAYEYPPMISGLMETISGVNSTARGNPDPNVKSGSFAALMDSKATHFQSAVQRAVVSHHQDIACGYVKLLKAVGGVTRVAEVAGRSGSRLKAVTSDEIETIDRVTVEQTNPALAQPGVRWELLQSLLKAGMIGSAQEALRVFTTGRIEPVLHAEEAELDLIAGENDLLSEGLLPAVCYVEQPAPPTPGMPPTNAEPTGRTCHPSDDHALHIREHKALLDLKTRRNPKLVKTIEKHLADHTAVAASLPPVVSVLTGQSVQLPGPAAPAAPPGSPQDAPPGPDSPKPGPKGLAKPEGKADRAKPGGAPGGPGQPLMPQNPVTGERVPA